MPNPPGTSSFQASFNTMTDNQLRQTISQLSTAAQSTYGTYRSPLGTAAYLDPKAWSANMPGRPTSAAPSRQRNRAARPSGSSTPAQTPAPPAVHQPAPVPTPVPTPSMPPPPLNPPRAPLPTTPQALQTTYPSRLRTGATLLMQPILSTTTNTTTGGRLGTRRAGVVNYADPASGDELDTGAVDTDDSDFVASGGTRTAIRQSRANRPFVNHNHHSFQAQHGTFAAQQKHDLDQSYLGMIPPAKFITAKRADPTKHQNLSEQGLETQASKGVALVPIRVEFETDTHRIRDCFVWNLYEDLIKPDYFARLLCADLDLPANPWVETVANQIRAQLEDHEGIASMDLMAGKDATNPEHHSEIPECRVILSIDVQIGTYHLVDHIEWDLLSSLSPEQFAQHLCMDLGLAGESAPLIAHAIHEEILKHKKDAVEWGVIGGEKEVVDELMLDKPRDKSGLSLLKDKTGLGLGSWGRTPRDGRGPKALKSVWKDWAEADEFATRFDVLTAEDIERREVERERASRRLRRETSKFQYQGVTRRRR